MRVSSAMGGISRITICFAAAMAYTSLASRPSKNELAELDLHGENATERSALVCSDYCVTCADGRSIFVQRSGSSKVPNQTPDYHYIEYETFAVKPVGGQFYKRASKLSDTCPSVEISFTKDPSVSSEAPSLIQQREHVKMKRKSVMKEKKTIKATKARKGTGSNKAMKMRTVARAGQPPTGCPGEVESMWMKHKLQVMEHKEGSGRVFLACKDNIDGPKQLASCRSEDCGAGKLWCFLENTCDDSEHGSEHGSDDGSEHGSERGIEREQDGEHDSEHGIENDSEHSTGSTTSSIPSETQPGTASPGELGDIINFHVEVPKGTRPKLGIAVAHIDGKIDEFGDEDGLVEQWNKCQDSNEEKVKVGDVLEEVMGKPGTPEELLDHLREAFGTLEAEGGTLLLKFSHGHAHGDEHEPERDVHETGLLQLRVRGDCKPTREVTLGCVNVSEVLGMEEERPEDADAVEYASTENAHVDNEHDEHEHGDKPKEDLGPDQHEEYLEDREDEHSDEHIEDLREHEDERETEFDEDEEDRFFPGQFTKASLPVANDMNDFGGLVGLKKDESKIYKAEVDNCGFWCSVPKNKLAPSIQTEFDENPQLCGGHHGGIQKIDRQGFISWAFSKKHSRRNSCIAKDPNGKTE